MEYIVHTASSTFWRTAETSRIPLLSFKLPIPPSFKHHRTRSFNYRPRIPVFSSFPSRLIKRSEGCCEITWSKGNIQIRKLASTLDSEAWNHFPACNHWSYCVILYLLIECGLHTYICTYDIIRNSYNVVLQTWCNDRCLHCRHYCQSLFHVCASFICAAR